MSEFCTIVSIVPFTITEDKPGLVPARYIIPASIDEEPQFLTINGAFFRVTVAETRASFKIPTTAEILARSIVEDYCSSQIGVTDEAKPGLFFLDGKRNSIMDEELHPYRTLQFNWFTNLARIADDDWNRYHKHNVVSDFQRIAARKIGWTDRPWMNVRELDVSEKCPLCRVVIPNDASICPNCKCVLNSEKVSEFSFVK